MSRRRAASPLTTASGRGRRFAVVTARFNADITESLRSACAATLRAGGVTGGNLVEVYVPGTFELPWACQRLARTKKFDAVIALGCVIRGETPHDRYIAQATAQGLMRVSLDTGVPVLFGVLTPLNLRQARARSGRGAANKGAEVARAALDVAALPGAV